MHPSTIHGRSVERGVASARPSRATRRSTMQSAITPCIVGGRLNDSPMTARLLDGKALAERTTRDVAARVAARTAAGKAAPGLAVVLVGENAASGVYVRNKRRTTETVGMRSFAHDLPATTSESDLLALIDRLNGDPSVSGILVQLPLPKHIDAANVVERIDVAQGRRRISSVQHRTAGAEDTHAAAVHAIRLHAAARGDRRGPGGPARGGDRPVEHRRHDRWRSSSSWPVAR